jgi:hypothetical protein
MSLPCRRTVGMRAAGAAGRSGAFLGHGPVALHLGTAVHLGAAFHLGGAFRPGAKVHFVPAARPATAGHGPASLTVAAFAKQVGHAGARGRAAVPDVGRIVGCRQGVFTRGSAARHGAAGRPHSATSTHGLTAAGFSVTAAALHHRRARALLHRGATRRHGAAASGLGRVATAPCRHLLRRAVALHGAAACSTRLAVRQGLAACEKRHRHQRYNPSSHGSLFLLRRPCLAVRPCMPRDWVCRRPSHDGLNILSAELPPGHRFFRAPALLSIRESAPCARRADAGAQVRLLPNPALTPLFPDGSFSRSDFRKGTG